MRRCICAILALALSASAQTPAHVSAAASRDYDGDGYLDAIELTLDRQISIPPAYSLSNIVVSYSTDAGLTVLWHVDSITPPPETPSASFVLRLLENTTTLPDSPQTAWTPGITIQGLDSLDTARIVTTDGAGPVVWDVVKVVGSVSDRTKDKVTLTFSERALSPGGEPLSFTLDLSRLLKCWVVENADTILVDSMLAGISNPAQLGDDYLVFFTMNGNDLTGRHRLSIAADTARIADAAGNTPHANNQKVRVRVVGDIGAIYVGPNPMYPTFEHMEDTLANRQPQEAFQWAKNEGGSVMVSDIVLPDDPSSMRVTGSLLIEDPFGNEVYSVTNDSNVIPSQWMTDGVGGESRQLVFYWNGTKNDGTKASPGIYVATTTLIDAANQDTISYTGSIMIANSELCEDSMFSGCGLVMSTNPVLVSLNRPDAHTVNAVVSNLRVTRIDSMGIDEVSGLRAVGEIDFHLALWTITKNHTSKALADAYAVYDISDLCGASNADTAVIALRADTLWAPGEDAQVCVAMVYASALISPHTCAICESSQAWGEDSPGCGSCGSGAGLAFLPALWCAVRRSWRRRPASISAPPRKFAG